MDSLEETVSQIKARIDIVELISEYLPLKKAGANFKCLSPFRNEKTPSFVVSPEKQIFHCFSSGEGGDIFSFLMKHEHMSFGEALKILADRAGVPLQNSFKPNQGRQKDSEEVKRIYEAATQFYNEILLKSPEAEEARKYLALRGYSADAIKKFRIGFATSNSRNLFPFISKKGFSEKIILESGLFRNPKPGEIADLFWSRILFPIMNSRDEVIAFGGRVLGDAMPKYLNSPETAYFKKRNELYGLNWAKRSIAKADHVLIVEGYFDFLRLFESGFENTVATLGTALTDNHARILKRYTQKAIVLFDNDPAGIQAALKGMEVMVSEGLYVQVLHLPGSKDPDEFLKDNKPDAFRLLLKNGAHDFFDFKLNLLSQQFDKNNINDLSQIADGMFELLLKIDNRIVFEKYLEKLSNHLNINLLTLRSEIDKKRNKISKREVKAKTEDPAPKRVEYDAIEISLLRVLLFQPHLVEKLKEFQVSENDFQDIRIQEILRSYFESSAEVKEFPLKDHLYSEETKVLLTKLQLEDFEVEFPERFFEARVREIKIRKKEAEKRSLKAKIDALMGEGKGESEEISHHFEKLTSLKREISDLKLKPQVTKH